MFVAQPASHSCQRLLIFLRIYGVEPVYAFYKFPGVLTLLPQRLVLTLRYAAQRSHAHSEKLVEIVGVDAEKAQPFQQRHVLLSCLLKYAPVEIHPAKVAVDVV